jgi:hypothetical protein
VQRFENILKAAEFDPDHVEIGRLIQGDARKVDVDVLLADLAEYHDLDHVPQYVLIGYGYGNKWGSFGYIDDLSDLSSVAVDMNYDAEEISSVVAYDLDNEGKEVDTYSEESWMDYWEDDEDDEDDYDDLADDEDD